MTISYYKRTYVLWPIHWHSLEDLEPGSATWNSSARALISLIGDHSPLGTLRLGAYPRYWRPLTTWNSSARALISVIGDRSLLELLRLGAYPPYWRPLTTGTPSLGRLSPLLATAHYWGPFARALISVIGDRSLLELLRSGAYLPYWRPLTTGTPPLGRLSPLLATAHYWGPSARALISLIGDRSLLELLRSGAYLPYWRPLTTGDPSLGRLSPLLATAPYWGPSARVLISVIGDRSPLELLRSGAYPPYWRPLTTGDPSLGHLSPLLATAHYWSSFARALIPLIGDCSLLGTLRSGAYPPYWRLLPTGVPSLGRLSPLLATAP